VSKYRPGKTDLGGSIEGITFVEGLADGTSILNRFLQIVNTTSANVSTLNLVDTSAYYIKAFLQKDNSAGETVVYLAGQIELYGYNLGAAMSDAQSFTSSIKFIGNDPMVYTKKMA
jgi:hypothetical protein